MKSFRTAVVSFALALAVLLAGALPALADGIIWPNPSPPDIRPIPVPYLDIKYQRVEVSIDNQVATTKVDQVFVNPTDMQLEGTYLFPLPADASISRFVMYVDGQPVEGKVLDKDEARRIYEDIVRKSRDPALLQQVGKEAFQARVFPIPPRGEKRVQIEYTQVLRNDQGLVHYRYPLRTQGFATRPLQELTISVTIKSKQAIKSVYSPSHEVDVVRPDDFTAKLGFEKSSVVPDKDFDLYYSLSDDTLGLNLLTFQQKSEPGFFLLLLAPQVKVDTTQVASKDLLLVLDISGSMAGEKITQAKAALKFILSNLREGDRFNIIAFSTSVRRFSEGLSPVSQRDKALAFVTGLEATGGTNINDALLSALKDADKERPLTVIFLTDGLPTVGVTGPDKIVDSVKAASPAGLRLFAFGVGYDVNTILLDTLAQDHGGAAYYVKPGESLEEKLSSFYKTIQAPVLTGLSLDFGGIKVDDLYPTTLPDLFQGSQLILVGRYTGSGKVTLTLKGKVNGQEQTFIYPDITFAQDDTASAFIPRLWATRKIGYLLAQIRLHGTNKELVDEIVLLSKRYGIITPYTSFLVQEPSQLFTDQGVRTLQDNFYKSTTGAPGPYGTAQPLMAPTAGPAAVQQSQQLRGYTSAQVADSGSQSQAVRVLADKAFILQNGIWTDTTYAQGMRTQQVQFGSDAYFKLLAAEPRLAQYAAVGNEAIVVWNGTAYHVSEQAVPPLEPTPTPQPKVTPGPQVTPTPIVKATPTPVVKATPTPTVTGGQPPAAHTSPLAKVGDWFRGLWYWLKGLFG